MPTSKQVLAILSVVALCMSGCAATQRRTVSGVVAAVGGLATIGGIEVATGCSIETNDEHNSGNSADSGVSCSRDDLDPNPEVGLPIFTVGLSLIVVAGIVYATSLSHHTKSAYVPPPSADAPSF
jgi:hypothetical protein